MVAISHLRSFQALECVLRTGTLRAAAAELSVTPAAVGQRIQALEEYLGVELLVRGRAGIRPTRELQSAMLHLTVAFDQLGAAASALEFHKADEIHIVADSDWVELWLAPRLDGYRQVVPNTRFCVNGVGDARLRIGNADCEVRFGGSDSGADFLFRDYLTPVTSPENLRRVSPSPLPTRLDDFPLLHLDFYRDDPEAIGWKEWTQRFGHRTGDAGRGIRYQRIAHALDAVRSDAGTLLCGIGLLLDDIRGGTVCLPFDVAEGKWTGHGYAAAFRKSALKRRQVVRFREWLIAESRATQAALDRFVAEGRL